MGLFRKGKFKSHSGVSLDWKIDCDALSGEDIETLAKVIGENLVFGSVIGIPSGGLRLAKALSRYARVGPVLIVDDVMTTGASMETERKKHIRPIGVVLFNRSGKDIGWITSMFTLTEVR